MLGLQFTLANCEQIALDWSNIKNQDQGVEVAFQKIIVLRT